MMVWKHDCMKVQVPDQVLIRYEGVEVWNMKVWVLDQVPDQALLCVLRMEASPAPSIRALCQGGHAICPCPMHDSPHLSVCPLEAFAMRKPHGCAVRGDAHMPAWHVRQVCLPHLPPWSGSCPRGTHEPL